METGRGLVLVVAILIPIAIAAPIGSGVMAVFRGDDDVATGARLDADIATHQAHPNGSGTPRIAERHRQRIASRGLRAGSAPDDQQRARGDAYRELFNHNSLS